MKLRVLDLNIGCSTPWDSKKDKLLEIVKELKPDIVCLQEVAQNFSSDTPRYNQNERIQELLGAKVAHSIITHPYVPDGERAKENCLHGPGIFILNQDFEVGSFEDIKIFQGIDRAYYNTAVKLTIDGNPLLLVNVHLSAEARHEEAQATLAWIKEANQDEPSSVLICGDLNPHEATTGSDVDSAFRSQYTDAWRELRPDDDGATYYNMYWWSDNYPDSPQTAKKVGKKEDFPNSTLDYVFYDGISPVRIEKVEDSIPEVSDHAGLLFEFTL